MSGRDGNARAMKRPRTQAAPLQSPETNGAVVRSVRDAVMALCERRGRHDKLPGPLAVTMSRAYLANVVASAKKSAAGAGQYGSAAEAAKRGYWVCEKSDGECAMLFATSRYARGASLTHLFTHCARGRLTPRVHDAAAPRLRIC